MRPLMPLVSGTKLGPYEILSPLGAGGMGEVYRARDTTLRRDVAIKVLPAYWSRDPDRLARFEQEAQSAAALNHPNIVSIFHVGDHAGAPYIITELLQGETLRERLRRDPMRLRDVLDIGIGIAHGLAAAHDAGIVHRDLKPENLFLTKDGRVKILDFGLAKPAPARAASVEGATVTYREPTSAGQVLGTASYMSPEQVRGEAADARSDIFALGAILYEMLTGHRAFRRDTDAETMTAILKEDPFAGSAAVTTLPLALQRIVQRCLAKNPEQRFQHASDLAFALESLSDSSSTTLPSIGGHSSSKKKTISAAAAAIALALVGMIVLWTRPAAVPVVGAITRLTDDEIHKDDLQTDGARVYFNEDRGGSLRLAQVSVKGGSVAVIPTSIPEPHLAGITPDGSSLLVLQGGFPVPRPVWEVPLPAGDSRRFGNLQAHEASVTPDGRLLLCNLTDLLIAEKDGSNPHKVLSVTRGHFGGAEMSPDGRRIVFTLYPSPGPTELYVVNSDGSKMRLLARSSQPGGFCCARWTPDGHHIVFSTRGTDVRQDLWSLRMDDGWLQPPSEPKRLTAGPLSYWHPAVSRDGKTIFAAGTQRHAELLRYDLPSKNLVPFFSGLSASHLTFSSDGEWAAYLTYPDWSLWRSRNDGTDRLQLTFPPIAIADASISPDGKWVVYDISNDKGSYIVSTNGGAPRKILDLQSNAANWSPDGNLLALGNSTTSWQTPEVTIVDVRTGQASKVTGGQLGPQWVAPGKLIAARRDMMVLQIYDVSSQQWSDLTKPEDGPVALWAHSPDFKDFYYTTAGEHPRLFRTRLADLKPEVVANLKEMSFPSGASYVQLRVAPDGSPIFVLEVGTQEIYALDVKWP